MRGKQTAYTLEKQDIRVGWQQSAQNTYNKGTRINYSILLISNSDKSVNCLLVIITVQHLLLQARCFCMSEKLLATLACWCAAG